MIWIVAFIAIWIMIAISLTILASILGSLAEFFRIKGEIEAGLNKPYEPQGGVPPQTPAKSTSPKEKLPPHTKRVVDKVTKKGIYLKVVAQTSGWWGCLICKKKIYLEKGDKVPHCCERFMQLHSRW